MPFLQRVIEPVHVCRSTLPLDDQGVLAVEVPNELECVTNGTLANIIRQLSSLSRHAEDMFSSLFRESSAIVARASSLQGRIDRLAVKVTQLDSTVEEVSLQDIHMRKAFKSYVLYEQQVVSRESMPAAMRDTYFTCDKPPPLDKLNPYREDGKDGLKFYTDPNYFFDLWKQEMLKETEKISHDRGRKVSHCKDGVENHNQRMRPECKKHKKSRQQQQQHQLKEKYRQMAKEADTPFYPHQFGGGAVPRIANHVQQEPPLRPNSLEIQSSYFGRTQGVAPQPQYPPPPPAYTEHPMSPQQHYPPPPYVPPEQQQSSPLTGGTPTRSGGGVQNRMRPSQPPPAPPSSTGSSGSSTPTVSAGTPSSGAGRYPRGNLPPPPPPPPAATSSPSPPATETTLSAGEENSEGKPREVPSVQNNVESNHSSRSPPLSNGGSNKTSPDRTAETEEPSLDDTDLPPPPPFPDAIVVKEKPRSPSPVSVSNPPPPPPPPLPPLEDLALELVAENGSISENQNNAEVVSITSESASETSSVSKFSEHFAGKSGHNDGRSDLLAAIREGIKLRRVEDIKQKEVEKAAPLHDVASILARRVAIEFSDSDSASGSEYDSEGWEDDGGAEHPKT